MSVLNCSVLRTAFFNRAKKSLFDSGEGFVNAGGHQRVVSFQNGSTVGVETNICRSNPSVYLRVGYYSRLKPTGTV